MATDLLEPLVPLDDNENSEDKHRRTPPSLCTKKSAPLLCALLIGFAASILMISIVSPFFQLEALNKFDMTNVEVGLVTATYPLVILLFAPLTLIVRKRIDRVSMMTGGLAILGASSILFGCSSASWMFYFFRFFQGVGSSFFDTAFLSLLTALFSENIGAVMGLQETVAGVGFMIGPPIGSFFYNIGGFDLPFIVMGLLCWVLCTVLPIFVLCFSDRKEKEGNPERSDEEAAGGEQKVPRTVLNLQQIMSSVHMAIAATGLVLFSAAMGVLVPFLSDHFVEVGLSKDYTGLFYAIPALAYALAAPFIGYLCDRLGPRPLMVIGLLVVLSGQFLIGPFPPLAKLLGKGSWVPWVTQTVSLVLLGAGAGMSLVPVLPYMTNIVHSKFPPAQYDGTDAIAACFGALNNFGDAFGPIVGGWLVNSTEIGFAWAQIIYGGILVVYLVVLFTFGHKMQKVELPSSGADSDNHGCSEQNKQSSDSAGGFRSPSGAAHNHYSDKGLDVPRTSGIN